MLGNLVCNELMLPCVLIRVPTAVIKHQDPSQLREEKVYSIIQGRRGRKCRQKPGGMN